MLWDEQVTLGQGGAIPTSVHSLMCPDDGHMRLHRVTALKPEVRGIAGSNSGVLGWGVF